VGGCPGSWSCKPSEIWRCVFGWVVPDISKDYSGFNFRVKQPKGLQPFWGGWGVGRTERYNVTCHKTLSGATLLWELRSHILLHIWVGLGPSQHRHCVLTSSFCGFLYCFRQILGWCLDLGHCHFQTLSTALFTDHAVIWWCSVWAAHGIVRKP